MFLPSVLKVRPGALHLGVPVLLLGGALAAFPPSPPPPSSGPASGGGEGGGGEGASTAWGTAPLLAPLPEEPVRAPDGGLREFRPLPAPFPASVGGESLAHAVQAFPVPGGQVVEIVGPPEAQLLDRSGVVEPEAPGLWRWVAPRGPGAEPLRLATPHGLVELTLLLTLPMEAVTNGALNGYPIGRYRYRTDPATGNPVAVPPEGFVEVRPQDEDLLVSPHFTLGQFACKEPGDPRYLVLGVPLVTKLEAVLEAVNSRGFDAPTLHLMSAYRTPAYNRAIGNTTDFSRHLWGDAADIFIDTVGDGRMDDLNGDGRVDDDDAWILYRIVEEVERVRDEVPIGGLSLYRANAVRGPFVHVDARGVAARW